VNKNPVCLPFFSKGSVSQVFLLVDEGTVEKYKVDLSDEIEPQITELISRAEKGMKALQKKYLALQTKVPEILYMPRCIRL